MAKGKNEILLSIALEGDAEIKSKLQAVGEAGKKSLADIEKKLGSATGQGFDRIAESAVKPLAKINEALAPLLEGAGLSGLAGGGGIVARLFGAAGPAAAIAALSGLAVHLAKVSEETERQQGRLKGLGDSGGFGKLTEQAKQLGTNVSDLQPRYEKFLAFQQKLNANNRTLQGPVDESASNVRVVGGGANTTPPSGKAFQAFDSALFNQIRRDVKDSDVAHGLADQFNDSLFKNGLTGDSLRGLQQSSPHGANFITDSLSPQLGRRFANPNELATLLDRGGAKVGATDLINQGGAKLAPEADKQAESARGVTQAFEGLKASAGRLDEALGKAAGGQTGKALTDSIDKVTGGIEKASDFVEKNGAKILNGPDRTGAPKSLTDVFTSDKGDLIGRAVNYALSGENSRTNGFGGGNPFGVITDFLRKAFGDPGALQQKPEAQQQAPPPAQPAQTAEPSQQPPPGYKPPPQNDFQYIPPPSSEEQLRLDRDRAQPPLSPSAFPAQQPSNTPIKFGETDQPQQVAGLGQTLQQALQTFLGSVTRQPDLKQQGPVDAIGIRGEGGQQGLTGVAEVDSSLKELAAVFAAAAANIKSSSSPVTVQAAATGGMIRRMDNGGHIRGPGTSTSDSIPIMASEEEFMIKATSARKLGLQRLNHMNDTGEMPGYARGGAVDYSRFRRFAEGGSLSTNAGGNHQITATPDGGAIIDGVHYGPGDAVLNDPAIQQALQRSRSGAGKESKRKFKSDFVGNFGGHEFGDSGSYAKGGMIEWPGFADGGLVGDMLSAEPHMLAEGGGAESLHPVQIHFEGQKVDGLRAPPDVVDALRKEAVNRQLAQTGPSPSWDR